MQNQKPNLFCGYSSQLKEIETDELSIIGDVPKWLSGSFVSNGPAKFDTARRSFNHWFDGFAMLKKFDFNSGKVSFQNRFLHSQQYDKSVASGKLNSNEFATYANSSLLGRLQNSLKGLIKGNIYDNCNVNTVRLHDHFIAMTESNAVIEFKFKDLSTIGRFQFDDNLQCQITTAHPQFDFIRGESVNVAIEIGRFTKYHIYKIAPNSMKREIIQTYISDTLFYMHSFSITENYVILFKSPLILNKLKLVFGLPFNNTIAWQKSKSSYFIIIDRRDGSIREIETDPFVCLHSANAYENGNEVVLDLICHNDGNPYDDLYLDNLRSENPILPVGNLKRYILDLNSKRCNYTTLSDSKQEFPRISYKTSNAKKYQFVYSNSITEQGQKFFNALQKSNVETGKIQCLEKENYYFNEAVFVAKPNSQSEDEGVLLSIALNNSNQISLLIIIDAKTMQELAEIFLPFYLLSC